jgi:hypothetical protein
MGLVAVAPAAQAQGEMSTTTTSTTVSTSQPTLVTGTVLRYYVDRSGYVTAMDVQTAEGVQFVRFSPGMGTRLYNTYPVGWHRFGLCDRQPGQPLGCRQRWRHSPGSRRHDDALLRDRCRTVGMPSPTSWPGAKMVTVSGKLRT